jgi:hypothetical protein
MITSGWVYKSLKALCTTAELKVCREGAHLRAHRGLFRGLFHVDYDSRRQAECFRRMRNAAGTPFSITLSSDVTCLARMYTVFLLVLAQ